MHMSYCRFENTSHDVGDCIDFLEHAVVERDRVHDPVYDQDLREEEMVACRRLRDLCRRFLEVTAPLESAAPRSDRRAGTRA